MRKKEAREVLVVQGEFDNLLNGVKSFVIIQLVVKNQEEAEQLLADKVGIYKKLCIKTIII